MTKHFRLPARPDSIKAVRADGTPATAQEIFNELKRTIEAFKDKNDEHLAEIRAGMDDVVRREHVDRINSDITALQSRLDEANESIASLQVGGGGGTVDDVSALFAPHERDRSADIVQARAEHYDVFNRWFTAGSGDAEASIRDLEVRAALTTQSNPDGGYFVPRQVEEGIRRIAENMVAMRQLAQVITISGKEWATYINMGGATAGWVGEEDTRVETSTPTLREILLQAHEQYAFPFTTQWMLDDAAFDVEDWLSTEVQIQFTDAEGNAFLNGDGNKKPRGLLDYPTVANSSYTWGKFGFVKSGHASAFLTPTGEVNPADCLITLYYALKAKYRTGAAWLMGDDTMATVRKFKDGQGNYLFEGPTARAEIPTLLGKPVYTDDYMPAVEANAFPIAFGDFARTYVILDRMGVRVLRDPFAVKGKVGFYTTKRVGGGVRFFEAMKFLKIAA